METRFDKYLSEGEKVLWSGKPEQHSTNFGYIFFHALLSIFFLILSSIWTFIAIVSNAPSLFKIIGITFIIFGIIFTPIHIILHKIRRSKIYYAISNKRIYIEYWFLRRTIKSYKISSLPIPSLRKNSNGLTTVLIYYEKPFSFWLLNFAPEYSWRDQFRRLEYIKKGQYVLNLIMKQRTNLW